MLRRRDALAGLAGLGFTAAFGLGRRALAAPQSHPNGPWVQESQTLSLEGLHSYEQLVDALVRLEAGSQGALRLSVVGRSNEGRDLYLASVGTGPRSILYLTQQHGNEPQGTEAAVKALRTLAQSHHPDVVRLREALTIHVLPRVNPDGAERYWRQNVDPDCLASQAACLPGRGFDLNRWHDPRVPDAEVPVPETLAVRQLYRQLRPELVVD